MTPTVTVIITTYNRADYVGDAVQSVLAQTFPDFELILIDDGSTDDTKTILEPYRDRLQYIYQDNRGLYPARNEGIRAARGRYVAFLDSDDLWCPGKLDAQVRLLDAHPDFGAVHTDSAVIDPLGNVIETSANRNRQTTNGMVFEEFFQNYMSVILDSSVMIRRSCFDAIGLFDETCPTVEAYGFFLRLAWRYPIYFLPEPLVTYRRTPGGLSRRSALENVRCREEILTRFIDQHEEFFAQHRGLLETKWHRFALESGLLLFHHGDAVHSRSYFRRALPRSPKALLYYLAAWTPPPLLKAIRRVKATLV